MLHFAQRPDRCFRAILQASLEIAMEFARRHTGDVAGNAGFQREAPHLARYFTPEQYVDLLSRLLEASADPRVFRLTDYHWLVLFDCLESFCAVHNSRVHEASGHVAAVGPYLLGPIDFEELSEIYFWDTDFLASSEALAMSPDERKNLGFSDQAWAIAAGMRPHPDDLRLEIIEGTTPGDGNGDSYPEVGVIPRYPHDIEDDDEG